MPPPKKKGTSKSCCTRYGEAVSVIFHHGATNTPWFHRCNESFYRASHSPPPQVKKTISYLFMISGENLMVWRCFLIHQVSLEVCSTASIWKAISSPLKMWLRSWAITITSHKSECVLELIQAPQEFWSTASVWINRLISLWNVIRSWTLHAIMFHKVWSGDLYFLMN